MSNPLNTEPLISVILPCYNAEKYLEEALASLVGQSYGRMEILAIDDGSSDTTGRIIQKFAMEDERVIALHNKKNLGLIRTLNRGVALAKGEYIARMDADDIAMLHRFEKQIDAFRQWPELEVLSVGAVLIDDSGRPMAGHKPKALSPQACFFASFICTPLLHPGFMAKSNVLKQYSYFYDRHTLHVEDYHLWTRMLSDGVCCANLKENLVLKRASDQSVSITFEALQNTNFATCSRKHIEAYFRMELDRDIHRILINRFPDEVSTAMVRAAFELLYVLKEQFVARQASMTAEQLEEIDRVEQEQKIDILIQLFKKGGSVLKLWALGYLMAHPRLALAKNSRIYIQQKL